MSADDGRRRSGAEWATFAASVGVLGLVVALLVGQLVATDDDPPAPVVAIVEAEIEPRGGVFHVPVDVHNDGDRAAANVQLLAELATSDGTESGDQTIDVLGAGETTRVVFVFAADPADGELTVAVGGFAVP